jgi:hypothetical protein
VIVQAASRPNSRTSILERGQVTIYRVPGSIKRGLKA